MRARSHGSTIQLIGNWLGLGHNDGVKTRRFPQSDGNSIVMVVYIYITVEGVGIYGIANLKRFRAGIFLWTQRLQLSSILFLSLPPSIFDWLNQNPNLIVWNWNPRIFYRWVLFFDSSILHQLLLKTIVSSICLRSSSFSSLSFPSKFKSRLFLEILIWILSDCLLQTLISNSQIPQSLIHLILHQLLLKTLNFLHLFEIFYNFQPHSLPSSNLHWVLTKLLLKILEFSLIAYQTKNPNLGFFELSLCQPVFFI